MDSFVPFLISVTQIGQALFASGHVVLFKRDVRAAIGWIAVIWLVPFGGTLLYLLFGINRIVRRARREMARREMARRPMPSTKPQAANPSEDPVPLPALDADTIAFLSVARLVGRISKIAAVDGNDIEILPSGAVAYQQMLAAIEGAQSSIGLMTYIFDNDEVGVKFADALIRAQRRGCMVRVLIDGVGARYSYPSISRYLQRGGVSFSEFLPGWYPLFIAYANLRNHRKVLAIDGRLAFTGGMNIRIGHARDHPPESVILDQHFRIRGPVVAQLVDVFADDWAFCTREVLAGDIWFPQINKEGDIIARAIAAGPDEAFERIRWTILGALSQAARRVRIVTPYFLPDSALATALALAALRGVSVEILLPAKGNLRLVRWASRAKLSLLAARNCQIWLTPEPFDHAKLMSVDGAWAMIGSANWDPRSLRLNFELNVECYSTAFTAHVDRMIDGRIAVAQRLTLADLQNRSLLEKLRDGACWLLSPYL